MRNHETATSCRSRRGRREPRRFVGLFPKRGAHRGRLWRSLALLVFRFVLATGSTWLPDASHRARGRCPTTLPYAIAVAARRRGGAPATEPGLKMKKTAVMGRRLARDAARTQRRQHDWRRRAREGLGSRRHVKFHQAPAGAYAAAVRRREGNSTAITASPRRCNRTSCPRARSCAPLS